MITERTRLLAAYKTISAFFLKVSIHLILYGSVGASHYIGNFKEFNDIDILIEGEWLKRKWEEFKMLMNNHGYILVDEKEHEFENSEKIRVAFAAHSVLVRDKIANLPQDSVDATIDGVKVKTFTAEAFLRAYEFSVDDGYRTKERGKKDSEAITLLKQYLEKST